MLATRHILSGLILAASLVHAQTPAPISAAPAATPAAPTAPAAPLSMNDQAFARSVSVTLQTQLQLSLAGKRVRANDPDLSEFSTKLNRSLTARWTPFVNVCQAHKFNSIAIDVSKNQAEAIAKMSKLKGAAFRAEYFKAFKPEAQRSIAFVTASLPRIQNAELKKNAEEMLTTFKATSEALEAKSAEAFTPPAAKEKPGKPAQKKKN